MHALGRLSTVAVRYMHERSVCVRRRRACVDDEDENLIVGAALVAHARAAIDLVLPEAL
jgi:hypothetical protein